MYYVLMPNKTMLCYVIFINTLIELKSACPISVLVIRPLMLILHLTNLITDYLVVLLDQYLNLIPLELPSLADCMGLMMLTGDPIILQLQSTFISFF